MPRHSFKFPVEVHSAIRTHVERAIERLDPTRFRQEPNYTAALAASLQGLVYRGEHGIVEFKATVFDDRGRQSAESIYGADFAITASISDGVGSVEKAIVIQSKLGRVSEINSSGRERLLIQIRKMRQLVEAPKIMQVVEVNGLRIPQIVSGNRVLSGRPYIAMPLAEYFNARVLTTLDGCTKQHIVEAVQDSGLSRVHVVAAMGEPAPAPITIPRKRVYQLA